MRKLEEEHLYKIIEFLLLIKLLKYHLIEKKTAMQDYQSLHIGLYIKRNII